MTTATQRDEQRNTTTEIRKSKKTAQWSKISTLMKNGLLLKNAAQIFRATAENRVSSTRRATHTAHSKHSKRSYALFLRFENSNTAGQHNKQRVGLFTAPCLRY
jgi:type II secretory pathway component PulF